MSTQINYWQPREGYMLHNRINGAWSDMVYLGAQDRATDWLEEPIANYEAWLASQGQGSGQEPSGDDSALADAKWLKVDDITAHAATLRVFMLNGVEVSLEQGYRNALDYTARCWQAKRGTSPLTIDVAGQWLTLAPTQLTSMLAMVECYAVEVANQAEAHKAAVNAMTSVEAVSAYDHTAGYPSMLTFDFE